MTRKDLILNTARRHIVQHGLFDSSIGKIAKEADIPVGSVYTYFASKEALINEIFVQVKAEMNAWIFVNAPENLPEREELGYYWRRAVEFGLNQQEKFFFAEQFINSPLIVKQNEEAVRAQFAKTYALLARGAAKGMFKNLPVEVLHGVVYTHIVGIIKLFSRQPAAFTPVTADTLFATCWDGICA